jgi:hypothetical protein
MMKRIKAIFIIVAILVAIGAAYATRPCDACAFADQYYDNGSGYTYAGEYGSDYLCLQYGGICTYYRPYPIANPDYFVPCRLGRFTPVP